MNNTTSTASGPSAGAPSWGPAALHQRNERTRQHQDTQAPRRERWIRKNRYYYALLRRLLGHLTEPGKKVLHVGCETGFLLDALQPSSATGVDPSREMLAIARSRHPN